MDGSIVQHPQVAPAIHVGTQVFAGREDLRERGFDGYQGSVEPATTQLAQRFGFNIGIQLRTADELIRMNDIRNNPGRFNPFEPKF